MAASVWDQRPADMQPSDVRFEDVVQYNILERKPYSTTLKVPTREDLGDKHCVLKSAISEYVHPVKHRLHVWRPATRTRHLHPSLVLYQPGSLMSSHVFSCLGKLFAGSHAYLLLGTCMQCPMPFLCEFAQIESFPSSKTWKYGKKISGIDRIRNSMLVTQV